MKINNPSFEIWEQEPGIDGIYRQVERAGRVCYKSEDHQTADSARPFVNRMIQSEHTAMLEHATVYLLATGTPNPLEKYRHDRFSRVAEAGDGTLAVTTNLRVLVQNGWMDDLDRYLCAPTPHHERRVTVHFTTQVAITREFNRHRANSMAEQSTRYCNYSKAKFGNEITINLPTWVSLTPRSLTPRSLTPSPSPTGRGEGLTPSPSPTGRGADTEHTLVVNDGESPVEDTAPSQEGKGLGDEASFLALAAKVAAHEATDEENWRFANLAAEKAYMNLIAAGRKPQEARVILPLDTNTELVHTAFLSDWRHFFDLRALGTTGAPHPDAKAIAMPLYEAFKEQGWVK